MCSRRPGRAAAKKNYVNVAEELNEKSYRSRGEPGERATEKETEHTAAANLEGWAAKII
jgi:hypothetical protein